MVNFIKRDGNDIFNKPILGFLFKNKIFLFILRVIVLFLFLYAIYYGFTNPEADNIFTSAVFWGVFWSLFMVTTLPTFGRIFCGICPHGFLGKYITKFGLKKTMPKWMQNRYIGIAMLVVGWWAVYYTFPGFWKSPLNTAIMFGVLTVLSFIIYYIYKDMSYCKYICPIGTLTRAYDKLSFTKLETYTDSCKDCKTFECASSCPYNLKPFTFAKKNQTEDCTLCMECAHSCEAVKFKFTKPAEQLGSKLKLLNSEIWTYILILACIPVSMGFAHGLNRSKIADEFIWNKTAVFFDMSAYAGGFAFLYAVLFTSFFSVFGLYLASKVLKKEYSSIFTNLGVALIPLFIFASLGHTLESFFTSGYSKIVEGFAQGLGLNVEINNLAKRGDAWLHYFGLFKWIGIIWAFILLYKRMKLIDATKLRKILAYFLASFAILFYIGLNIYSGYVFSKYGVKLRGGHSHSKNSKKIVDLQKTSEFASKDFSSQNLVRKKIMVNPLEEFYFSLSDPTNKQKNSGGRGHTMGKPSGKPNGKKEIPTKKVWLSYNSKDLKLFYYDINQKEKEILKTKSRGKTQMKFEVPNNGYYNLFAVDEKKLDDKVFYKVAKLEYLNGRHGNEDIYNEKIKKQLKQNKTKIDLIRIKSEDEDSFFYKHKMGNELKFQALFENKPLSNAKVKIKLESGWIKELKTDKNGFVSFILVRDYFPKWNEFNKRFKQDFLITLEYEKGDANYILTYPSSYYPNSSDYESYGYGLILLVLTLLASGIIVYRFRRNRTKTFSEIRIHE
ncbi:MAG: hypothetical protein C0625_14760 [Arcobacter sp.]|nr:MAG: hypothetical protein C0625_14760 [Arcobacter sp.]